MAQQLDNAENTRASLNTSKADLQTLTKTSSALDSPPFQHHFKDIKSPFATSVEKGKDQDNQAWAGTCCNYG